MTPVILLGAIAAYLLWASVAFYDPAHKTASQLFIALTALGVVLAVALFLTTPMGVAAMGLKVPFWKLTAVMLAHYAAGRLILQFAKE